MAHKKVGEKVVVDWTTGDPEGDRINLLSAYRDFINEVQEAALNYNSTLNGTSFVLDVFDRWGIDTKNQIDEVPRIWITRPEQQND